MNAALFAGVGIGLGCAVLVNGAIAAGGESLAALAKHLLAAGVISWAVLTMLQIARDATEQDEKE